MKLVVRRKILVAPLDWGLGHATRCIPIIYALLDQGHEVIIAAEGPIQVLLQQEFPGIECLLLKGYHIKYGKTKSSLFFKMIAQIPKILYMISWENRWLKKVVKKNKIDIVISDNRFGLSNKNIYSIFITHQLVIKTPVLQSWLKKLNYNFIDRFDECWIPDFEMEPNLAGVLSHQKKLPASKVRYIGWLSRFHKAEKMAENHLLILLSGPEPQRTLLEKKIMIQLEKFPGSAVLIRGLPGNTDTIPVSPHIHCANHLPTKELQSVVLNASYVVARSGYSTVMDLLKLEKKTILIPTPGQTEQEYLAKHLSENTLALCAEQETFDLEKTLSAAGNFNYCFYNGDATILLQNALSSLTTISEYK